MIFKKATVTTLVKVLDRNVFLFFENSGWYKIVPGVADRLLEEGNLAS